MQSAKDSFYEMLRARVVAGNPDRTVVVRSVTRPGVVVVENELVSAVALVDCFRLSWSETKVDARGGLPMVAMTCEVAYETAGSAANAGMDRGRMLAAMDGELLATLRVEPRRVLKTDYSGLAFGKAAVARNTNVWWGDVVFGDVVVEGERLKRTAIVPVMSYEEAGEL